MLNVYNTNEVIATIPVPIYLRCVAAGCTCLGALLMGGRLMPVTGKTAAHMTWKTVVIQVMRPTHFTFSIQCSK